MVITIDSGTWALIYEFALIHAIFGLDWIGSGFSGNFMDWIGLDPWVDGLDWIGSAKMDPCPTLAYRIFHSRVFTRSIVMPTQVATLAHSAWPFSAGRCSEYWRWFRSPMGKKRRILRSRVPSYQDCWHSGLSWLKAMAVNLSRHGCMLGITLAGP